MKYLSHYMQDAQTKLYNETGAFFAFSEAQFNEAIKAGVTYCSVGWGLFCNAEHKQKLIDGLKVTAAEAIAQDLAENGKDNIIKRELHNYEAYYSMSITDTVKALECYGITHNEVLAVYKVVAPTIVDY